jgi:hypothetical protein
MFPFLENTRFKAYELLAGRIGQAMAHEEQCPAVVISVESERQVRSLAEEILGGERDYPVVCLTARPGERTPGLSGERVRGIVGSGIPVYFIAAHRLTRRLGELLPERLGVWGGASRVWWPGVSGSSDPEEHLLVYDAHGVYGDYAYELLAGEFRVAEQPELSVEQRLVLAERARAHAETRRRDVERRMVELRRLAQGQDRRSGQGETSVVEERACEPRSSRMSPVRPEHELDFEQRLHVMITGEWVCALTATDRLEYPLGRYVFGHQFAGMVEGRRDVPVERVARVCALLACGRTPRAGPLRTGGRAHNPHLVRSDGARAWRCNLKTTSNGPRLHYWVLVDGTIEFASINVHDDFSIPGG